MFAPVLDEDEEFDQQEFQQHQPLHHDHAAPDRLAFGTLIARVVKLNNILLLLSLGVATFIQFCTLEPRYVNALMWAGGENGGGEHPYAEQFLPPSLTLMRTLQSLATVLMLSFVRTVIVPSLLTTRQQPPIVEQQEDDGTDMEAIMRDMLLHIQCRLIIGFLACFTTPWIPFGLMETTVVCLSMSLQITKLAVLQ